MMNSGTVHVVFGYLYPPHVADKLHQGEEGHPEIWRVFVIRRVVGKANIFDVWERLVISEK